MKLKQILAIVLSLALVACISVAATVAYLTDETAPVVNTFTVGKVAITLYETKVDEYGVPSVDPSAGPVKENKYKLLPNKQYTKDPYITVEEGSENCWLFVEIKNGIADIEDDENKIEAQMIANGWKKLGDAGNIWAYTATVGAGTKVDTFKSFKISEAAKAADLAKYQNAEIRVTAYAIQREGFDTAEAAWTGVNGAFESVEKDTTTGA